MNFKFMNKKIIVSIITVLILLLIAGGVFWWLGNREIKGSPEDYVVKETEQGKIIENKKAGFTVKVPEGWEIQKMKMSEGSIVITTPTIKGRIQNDMTVPPLTKGCGIEISVIYKDFNFEELEEEIKSIHWGLDIKSEKFEKISINDYPVLKNTFNSEILGSVIAIYIPTKNKLYDFDLYWAPDEKEKCIQEFNKFLETVSIK